MPKAIDITGHRFGRLTAVSRHDKPGNRWRWLCRCDCGKAVIVQIGSLRSGNGKSCGCLQKEIASRVNTTHGMSKTREFFVWKAMLQRCLNPNCKDFKYYGGRGIKPCERWLEFTNYFADTVVQPEGLTLDRIDNNGNYEKSNCRWATPKQQSGNRRPTKGADTQQATATRSGDADGDG